MTITGSRMDIKSISLRSYAVVSTQTCRQPQKQFQEALYAVSPMVSDDIIDYAEVQSNHYRPVLSRQPSHSIRMDQSAAIKGTLIDIWA
jgi:hypothetical protein